MDDEQQPQCRAFKGDRLDGKGQAWGVQDKVGAIIYDAQFTQAVAERIAELENSDTPPRDWDATKAILISEGLLPPERDLF